MAKNAQYKACANDNELTPDCYNEKYGGLDSYKCGYIETVGVFQIILYFISLCDLLYLKYKCLKYTY